MCGAFGVVTTVEAIQNKVSKPFQSEDKSFKRYIIRVGETAPVIIDQEPDKIQDLVFGFTPSWSKHRMYLFDGESEGIITKPFFKVSIRKKRCLIPATHFIMGTRELGYKKPYCIHLIKDRPFFLAGVWDEWKNPGTDEIIRSFALISCPSNALLASYGILRSPVVISSYSAKDWICRDSSLSTITNLLSPTIIDKTDIYPISPERIKNRSLDDISIIKPIGLSYWKIVAEKEKEKVIKMREEKLKLEKEEQEYQKNEIEKQRSMFSANRP